MRLLAIALLAASPALAQESPAPQPSGATFQPPPGCTAYVTVQMASCTVSHHFTCEGDPAGWQRRVDMDESGIAYAGVIDAETQWIESIHFLSSHSEELAPDPADPASFSKLVETGLDTFDFTTNSAEIGPTRYVGQDRLTGESVTIDGVTLDRTEYSIQALDAAGKEVWRSAGTEYISRDWRMFLSGTGTTRLPEGDASEGDDTPVDFIFPAEKGFLSVRPTRGCGQVMSSFEGPMFPLKHREQG